MNFNIINYLWNQWESNPRPSECKSDALAKLSYGPEVSGLIIRGALSYKIISFLSYLVQLLRYIPKRTVHFLRY